MRDPPLEAGPDQLEVNRDALHERLGSFWKRVREARDTRAMAELKELHLSLEQARLKKDISFLHELLDAFVEAHYL
jgi:hypothetical protein